jgi:hypothetical protein
MRNVGVGLLCAAAVVLGGCSLFSSGILYEETWSDTATTAWTLGDSETATKSIDGGRYHVLVKQAPQTLVYWNDDEGPFGNVQIDVDVKHEAGVDVDSASGLVFRVGSINDFYLFQLSAGSYRVLKWVGGVSSVVKAWTQSTAIKTGVIENHLTVLADGTSLTFLINATEVAEITDASHSTGYVGVSVQSWNVNVEESFDNLVVREL